MMEKMTEYQGTPLYAREVEVLLYFEHLLGKPIPRRGSELGFKAEEGTVTELILRSQGLTSLPKSIEKLRHLKKLDLHKNQLSSLPEALGYLKNLQNLNLNYNQMTVLPETLSQLSNLQAITLWDNQLVSLPDTFFSQLTNLQGLTLDKNRLTALPTSLYTCTNLVYLGLRGNNLKTFSADLGNLVNLYELHVENNQLTFLPETIGKLTRLRYLYLAENQLTALPTSLGDLENLFDLSLKGNPLQFSSWVRVFRMAQKRNINTDLDLSGILNGHPLVTSLDLSSLSLNQTSCPFCGASELISGQNKETRKDHLFCGQCEQIIS
ncbi:MAG: leucine-rich repeat domain-containing protein [Promethearchaeota archaeon]